MTLYPGRDNLKINPAESGDFFITVSLLVYLVYPCCDFVLIMQYNSFKIIKMDVIFKPKVAITLVVKH